MRDFFRLGRYQRGIGKIKWIRMPEAYTLNGWGSSWSWSYGSWIYNYLYGQFLSPLTLRVWTPFRRGVLVARLCDKVCQWLATGRWFPPGTPVSSTNKTDHHEITEILLKVALNTIKPKPIHWMEVVTNGNTPSNPPFVGIA